MGIFAMWKLSRIKCKHQRENIDRWKCACDACPDGMSSDFIPDESRKKYCNNGIGYNPDPEKVEFFK